MKSYDRQSINYKICDILASVTASNRTALLDELRALGDEKFIEKYQSKELLKKMKEKDLTSPKFTCIVLLNPV